MKIYYPIAPQSAIQFWREALGKGKIKKRIITDKKYHIVPKEYLCPATIKKTEEIHEEVGIDLPITFVQPAKKYIRHTRAVNSIVRAKNLPQEAFLSMGRGMLMASPEYCFLYFANVLSYEKLVELGNDLCSIYVIDKKAKTGQSSSHSICSADELEEFVEKVRNFKGVKNARAAIKFVVDKSKSPRESKLAAIMFIPVKRGGYGLPKGLMNFRISLSKDGVALAKCKFLSGDIVWLDQKLVVEYDSDLTHLESNQHAFDKARVNALNQSGYRVITITKKTLSSLNDLDEMADTIRKALGLRSQKQELDKYKEKRWEVMKNLFYN